MKKLIFILLVALIALSCSPSVEKKTSFLKQATELIVQRNEFTSKIYSAKVYGRDVLDKRLNLFLNKTQELETVKGWDFSDSIKSNLLDMYKTDIKNNLIIDSLQKFNTIEVYIKVVELIIPVANAEENIRTKMKDQVSLLKIDLK